MNFDKYLLNENSTILEALNQIELNHNGFVLINDNYKKIIAVVTDGDIRRALVKGEKVENLITNCLNKEFIKATKNTPREILLKQLDNKIKFIPILDENGKLVSIVTRDFFPQSLENKIYSKSKSPVRISFGGGGSDTSTYFIDNNGAVINATISLYTHCTLRLRDDYKIIINSLDLNDQIEFDNIEELLIYQGKFSLIKSVIKAIKPTFGFELFLHSDFPMSSGLGGSAVVTSAILGCFNQFRNDKWDKHEISEIAFQAERLHLGVSGGWQDQYATVFGGLNFIEFNKEQNIINPIRLNQNSIVELEESLVLCYTGLTHDSGNIHDDQKNQTKQGNIKEKIKLNVDLTYEMRNHLLRGRLLDFGICLNKAWELKRGFSNKISSPWLDNIYNEAIQNGAIGGKILGAGGGGFFLFFVPAFSKNKLLNWIKIKGLTYTPFIFEDKGLQSWTVREN